MVCPPEKYSVASRATNPSMAIRPLMSSRPDVKMKLPFLGYPLRMGTIVATMKSKDTKAMLPGYDCTCWNTFLPVLNSKAKADTTPSIASLKNAQVKSVGSNLLTKPA